MRWKGTGLADDSGGCQPAGVCLGPESCIARSGGAVAGRETERARVGLPWECLLGFMRVVTNPRIYKRPAPVNVAWEQVEQWLSARNAWVPTPGQCHQEILGRFLNGLGGGAKLIPDAHLAALAIEHGLDLCSTDGDFARFEDLRWVNPVRHR